MELAQVIDWSRDAIRLALMMSGPPLAVALAVGLLIGIGQTLTQLHEPVVAMVPRVVAVLLVVLAILPWLISQWLSFTTNLIDTIPGSL
ncbi:flagellar biosynthetic protein FliQ [Singulisphaera sp. PoT]|uniref:flagellar biosynthetic protein FliQ n=1 Tax=Singulisphaera sp. PoT TaxID=3411797 RepID=UPI003BF5100C